MSAQRIAPFSHMRTLDLNEAAAFLHMSPAALRQKAKAGVIQGAKPGKRWVFLEADLADHLRSLYAGPRQAPRSGCDKEASCHSTNAVVPGGSVLSVQFFQFCCTEHIHQFFAKRDIHLYLLHSNIKGYPDQ